MMFWNLDDVNFDILASQELRKSQSVLNSPIGTLFESEGGANIWLEGPW